MHFDFEMFLVLATVLTGVIWLLDVLLFRKSRQSTANREPKVVEYSRSFFPVILAVLLIRSFLGEPFRIPSSSMMPTLLAGDFILVNKFTYGLRLPVVGTEIVDFGEPERGDVVVFRYPPDPSQDYIKRVVGLPGDRISYRDDTLYINDTAVSKTMQGRYTGPRAEQEPGPTLKGVEALPGRDHDILLRPNYPKLPSGTWVVPDDQYFVMGDNRDNSQDSRVWGFVPTENLVGKAFLVWMHFDSSNFFEGLGRIGTSIQ